MPSFLHLPALGASRLAHTYPPPATDITVGTCRRRSYAFCNAMRPPEVVMYLSLMYLAASRPLPMRQPRVREGKREGLSHLRANMAPNGRLPT